MPGAVVRRVQLPLGLMRSRLIVLLVLLGGTSAARADDVRERLTKVVSHHPRPTATMYIGSLELPPLPQTADPRRENTRDPRGTAGMIWKAAELYVEVSVGGVRVHPTDPRSVSFVTGYVAWF